MFTAACDSGDLISGIVLRYVLLSHSYFSREPEAENKDSAGASEAAAAAEQQK